MVVGWWIAAAQAQGLDKQAEELMNLGFDLDAVQQKVSRKALNPAPAAAAPRPDYAFEDETVDGRYAPPPPPVPRLPLEPNSTLRSVTVHRDQALVTRVREILLTTGPHTVTFEGLPLGISSQGLTASVESGAAKITSVELISGSGEVDTDDRHEKIRVEAEKRVDELGDVRDRIEALLAERQFLRTALVPPGATAGMPVASVEKGLEFVSQAEVRIAHDLREELDKADDLGDEIRPLLTKMDDPLATGQPVRVDVDVDKGGPVVLALEYTVGQAGWSPSYSARLDPASGVLELGMFGVVTNSTAEDWTDAEISLSTADPTGRGGDQWAPTARSTWASPPGRPARPRPRAPRAGWSTRRWTPGSRAAGRWSCGSTASARSAGTARRSGCRSAPRSCRARSSSRPCRSSRPRSAGG
jgi:hypothetical protein